MEDKCMHCNVRIVKKYYALGAKWMHQPEGSSFNDFAYEFCKLYTAEPDIENLDTSSDEAEETCTVVDCSRLKKEIWW